MSPFSTLVVDPPWPPSDPRGIVGRTVGGGSGWQRRQLPYRSMDLEEIAALPVGALAAEDARCFLWTTNRYLSDAFGVLAAWGFSYRQTLVWHKTNASPYPRSVAVLNLEFLLVGQRGTPGRLAVAPSSLISGAITRNSEKPDAFLDLVEQVSPGPYAELFARRARFGWVYPIGDQALGGRAA